MLVPCGTKGYSMRYRVSLILAWRTLKNPCIAAGVLIYWGLGNNRESQLFNRQVIIW